MAINFPNNPTNGDTFTSGTSTWQWNGTVWNILGGSGSVTIPNSFGIITVTGQDNVSAATTTDSLSLVAGSNTTITTDAESKEITISSTGGGGGGGEANQNAFSIIAVSGQSNIEADTTTDTLTFVAGSGITLTTNSGNDTLTITSTASGGSSTLDTLTDVQTAGIDINDIYEHAIVTFRVDNVGTTAYTFNSHYTGNNPTIYVLSGTTVAFDLDAIAGHPFELQDNTLAALTSNLVHVAADGTVSTNASAQGKSSGTLYWRIPENITNNTNYLYQCQSHAGMFGTITIKRLSSI
jgi:plastocyanin